MTQNKQQISTWAVTWIEWALYVAIGASLLLGVIMGVKGLTDDGAVPAKVHLPDTTITQGGETIAITDQTGILDILPTTSERALLILGGEIQLLVGILVAVVLLRIVRSVQLGKAFDTLNIQRLRLLALLVALGSLASAIRNLISNQVVANQDVVERIGADTKFDFDVSFVFAAVALLALTEVLRTGIRMRDELEGTV